MEREELQQKVNDSTERVNKRLATIEKLCKKLNINYGDFIASYNDFAINSKNEYMRHSDASEIVSRFISKKQTVELPRDENFDKLYWENCDFNSKVEQLSDNLPKLFDLERVLKNWKTKLEIEVNKDNMPKVEVIWNFLLKWKEMATEWYIKNAERYFELKRDYNKNMEEFIASDLLKMKVEHELYWYSNGNPDKIKESIIREWKKHYYDDINSVTTQITHIEHDYFYPNPDNRWEYEYLPVSHTVDTNMLNKILTKEMKAKYELLINQITSITGEITDATGLRIGGKGDINGTVIGVNGVADVNTFMAGIYHIVQCPHYRTRVTKVN